MNKDAERADEILGGSVRAAAMTISGIENNAQQVGGVLSKLYSSCGSAHLIGITGPPGAGKSTLVAALIKEFRAQELTVGVLAVDPSSPYSGGALLGDRDRMVDSALDSDVFIRSIAARGVSGGLTTAVNDVVDVLDAMGKDIVLIETVGVGQGEFDVARIAQTVVLTLVPNYGDSLQAMKAGINEIADVVVVNKSDVSGAETAAEQVRAQGLVRRARSGEVWEVPILLVSALRREGVNELVKQLALHRAFAAEADPLSLDRQDRRQEQFVDLVMQQLRVEFVAGSIDHASFRYWIARIEERSVDPRTAADRYITEFKERLQSYRDDAHQLETRREK